MFILFAPSHTKTPYLLLGLFSTLVTKLMLYRYFFPIDCEICAPTNQATVLTR